MSGRSHHSPQRHLAALRQLALLSPGGHAALPEAFVLLRGMVGCDTLNMFWLDADFNVTDLTPGDPVPMEVALDYMQNFAPFQERMTMTGMQPRPAFFAGQFAYRGSSATDFDRHALERSEFYHRILKPVGYGWSAGILCRGPEGKPCGGLGLGRELRARDFSNRDIELLRLAHPWVEHLLRRTSEEPAGDRHFTEDMSAVAVLDGEGNILSASAGALWLLHQAANSPLTHRSSCRRANGELALLLRRLARPVAAALHGLAAPLPAQTIDNRWGRFHLRAYGLNPFMQGEPMQVSLHVERQVPLSTRLFRAQRFLALSTREREVALHLLGGRSHAETATAMNVKISTVIYFARQIYAKLDIANRQELAAALLRE